MSRPNQQLSLNRDDYWRLSHAAGQVTSYACSVSAKHIQDSMLRLQFNREVAYYMRGIVRDVESGRKTATEGMLAIQRERKSLASQSGTIAMHSLGLVAGGFQIAGGATMCIASSGLACGLGALTAIHGANNVYENGRNLLTSRTDTEGPVRKVYQRIAKELNGSDSAGNIAYYGIDIGLSGYNLLRKVPKPGAWRLFRYMNQDLVPAHQTIKPMSMAIEISADAASIFSIYNEQDQSIKEK